MHRTINQSTFFQDWLYLWRGFLACGHRVSPWCVPHVAPLQVPALHAQAHRRLAPYLAASGTDGQWRQDMWPGHRTETTDRTGRHQSVNINNKATKQSVRDRLLTLV